MICDICGHDSGQVHYVTRSYGAGETLLIIENVPVVKCSHCGETYLTAKTLHELERIKIHRDGFAHKQAVPVAFFQEAV